VLVAEDNLDGFLGQFWTFLIVSTVPSQSANMDADTQLSTSFSDYPELQVVFDFFADNPQKVMPSSATMDHSGSGEDANHGGGVLRQDPYWESIRIMQTSDLFMEGMLLRSVDCKRKRDLRY